MSEQHPPDWCKTHSNVCKEIYNEREQLWSKFQDNKSNKFAMDTTQQLEWLRLCLQFNCQHATDRFEIERDEYLMKTIHLYFSEKAIELLVTQATEPWITAHFVDEVKGNRTQRVRRFLVHDLCYGRLDGYEFNLFEYLPADFGHRKRPNGICDEFWIEFDRVTNPLKDRQTWETWDYDHHLVREVVKKHAIRSYFHDKTLHDRFFKSPEPHLDDKDRLRFLNRLCDFYQVEDDTTHSIHFKEERTIVILGHLRRILFAAVTSEAPELLRYVRHILHTSLYNHIVFFEKEWCETTILKHGKDAIVNRLPSMLFQYVAFWKGLCVAVFLTDVNTSKVFSEWVEDLPAQMSQYSPIGAQWFKNRCLDTNVIQTFHLDEISDDQMTKASPVLADVYNTIKKVETWTPLLRFDGVTPLCTRAHHMHAKYPDLGVFPSEIEQGFKRAIDYRVLFMVHHTHPSKASFWANREVVVSDGILPVTEKSTDFAPRPNYEAFTIHTMRTKMRNLESLPHYMEIHTNVFAWKETGTVEWKTNTVKVINPGLVTILQKIGVIGEATEDSSYTPLMSLQEAELLLQDSDNRQDLTMKAVGPRVIGAPPRKLEITFSTESTPRFEILEGTNAREGTEFRVCSSSTQVPLDLKCRGIVTSYRIPAHFTEDIHSTVSDHELCGIICVILGLQELDPWWFADIEKILDHFWVKRGTNSDPPKSVFEAYARWGVKGYDSLREKTKNKLDELYPVAFPRFHRGSILNMIELGTLREYDTGGLETGHLADKIVAYFVAFGGSEQFWGRMVTKNEQAVLKYEDEYGDGIWACSIKIPNDALLSVLCTHEFDPRETEFRTLGCLEAFVDAYEHNDIHKQFPQPHLLEKYVTKLRGDPEWNKLFDTWMEETQTSENGNSIFKTYRFSHQDHLGTYLSRQTNDKNRIREEILDSGNVEAIRSWLALGQTFQQGDLERYEATRNRNVTYRQGLRLLQKAIKPHRNADALNAWLNDLRVSSHNRPIHGDSVRGLLEHMHYVMKVWKRVSELEVQASAKQFDKIVEGERRSVLESEYFERSGATVLDFLQTSVFSGSMIGLLSTFGEIQVKGRLHDLEKRAIATAKQATSTAATIGGAMSVGTGFLSMLFGNPLGMAAVTNGLSKIDIVDVVSKTTGWLSKPTPLNTHRQAAMLESGMGIIRFLKERHEAYARLRDQERRTTQEAKEQFERERIQRLQGLQARVKNTYLLAESRSETPLYVRIKIPVQEERRIEFKRVFPYFNTDVFNEKDVFCVFRTNEFGNYHLFVAGGMNVPLQYCEDYTQNIVFKPYDIVMYQGNTCMVVHSSDGSVLLLSDSNASLDRVTDLDNLTFLCSPRYFLGSPHGREAIELESVRWVGDRNDVEHLPYTSEPIGAVQSDHQRSRVTQSQHSFDPTRAEHAFDPDLGHTYAGHQYGVKTRTLHGFERTQLAFVLNGFDSIPFKQRLSFLDTARTIDWESMEYLDRMNVFVHQYNPSLLRRLVPTFP